MNTRPCPSCGATFSTEDINLKEGVAICRECDTLVRLHAIAIDPQADVSSVNVGSVPKGCWVQDRRGDAVIGSVVWSPVGYFLLVWAIGWNAGVGTFVAGLISQWYSFFTGHSSSSRGAMQGGGLLFATLFMTPFAVIGIGSIVACVFLWFGKCEVAVDRERVAFFQGVGVMGRTKTLPISQASPVTLVAAKSGQEDKAIYHIQAGTEPNVRFGSGLKEERKNWMCAAVGAAVTARSTGRSRTVPPLPNESRA